MEREKNRLVSETNTDQEIAQEKASRHAKSWETLGDFTTTLRVLPISGLAVVIGAICAFVALALLRLIGLFTNLFYFGRWSTAMVSPVVVAYPDEPLRLVVHRMAEKGITRLPVVERDSHKLLGLVSLDDLLKARSRHLEEERRREQTLRFRFPGGGKNGPSEFEPDSAIKIHQSVLQKS
jgi:CBS domain-containing protein